MITTGDNEMTPKINGTPEKKFYFDTNRKPFAINISDGSRKISWHKNTDDAFNHWIKIQIEEWDELYIISVKELATCEI